MKVLSYVGRDSRTKDTPATKQAFQYERTSEEIIIDRDFNLDSVVKIPNSSWNALLGKIEAENGKLFTSSAETTKAAKLEDILRELPSMSADAANMELAPCILSILLNEGSLQLYHGAAGQGEAMFIPFHKGNFLTKN